MFSWIGDLFLSLIDTVVSIFSFLGNMIQSIFRLLANLPKMVSLLSTAIGFVPVQYMSFLTITISVAVMFFIVGKER